MTTLSAQEKDTLAQRIKTLELQTDGEMVMVITPYSDHYRYICAAYAAMLALVTPLFLTHWWGLIGDAYGVFCAQVFVFCVLLAIFQIWPVRRLLVTRSVMHSRAKKMAHELFFMQNVHHKTQRNAIMLFVSEAERYVEVLADRDMAECVSSDVWQSIVDEFIQCVCEGNVFDGYSGAIERCGALLIDAFPVTQENEDELPNHLIEWHWQQ
ncbi:MAG: TPM domain-containing protein [Pseudomonadota bacterium]